MASTSFFLSLAILVIFCGSTTATDYIVGDAYGWTTNVDYQAWAQGKQFFVGDRLIFQYSVGTSNVYKVNGAAFKQCTIPPQPALSTGNDIILLTSPGRKWYISGVGWSCQSGQKLAINVSPSPFSSPRKMLPAGPIPSPVSQSSSPAHSAVPAAHSWPILVASPPSWPTVPAPAPAPASPYWPWPIVFPPEGSAPAPYNG